MPSYLTTYDQCEGAESVFLDIGPMARRGRGFLEPAVWPDRTPDAKRFGVTGDLVGEDFDVA
jgi:hypothetical protein